MEYKISVIIPCYNSERTLKRCIESIINQTFGFQNIELILYDDDSTDTTGEIIKNYANKYDNIQPIFSNKNGGPGKGRNEGIKLSAANYIMFLDSDDAYDLNLCKVMYDEISNSDYDLICCGLLDIVDIELNGIDLSKNNFNKIEIVNDETLYLRDTYPVNKLYKKSIIKENNIHFPEHKYGEDLYFTIVYFSYCSKILYVPNYLGYYRYVQQDSISRSWSLEDLVNIIQTYSDIYNKLKNNSNIDYDRVFDRHIEYVLLHLCLLHLLENKSQVIYLLKELYSFEQAISFNGKFNSKVVEIANIFLLKKQFVLSYYYLIFIEKLYNLDKIKMLYRKLINLR